MDDAGRDTGERVNRRLRWSEKPSPRLNTEACHSQPHGDGLSPDCAKDSISSGLLRTLERRYTIGTGSRGSLTARTTMRPRNAERKGAATGGTGNVFADLGFPDAAERQAKLRLAYALNRVLEARKLSQADAANVLRVTQPKGSALRHYKLAGFSVERVMNLWTALDQDVES